MLLSRTGRLLVALGRLQRHQIISKTTSRAFYQQLCYLYPSSLRTAVQPCLVDMPKTPRRRDFNSAAERSRFTLDGDKFVSPMFYTAKIMYAESWRDVHEVMTDMKDAGMEMSTVHFNAAITVCAKLRMTEKALWLLDEMISRGIEPDLISYCSAINACQKGKQWEKALALLKKMTYRGMEPDLACFNAAVSACDKSNQWEEALGLLRKVRENGLQPNIITYSSAISACLRGKTVGASSPSLARNKRSWFGARCLHL